jgi:hypothetical protein
MLAVRNFLTGGVLCKAHGPLYYFYERLLHLFTALPGTHDVTRAQQNCIVSALERARRPRIILCTAPRWDSAGISPLRDLIDLRSQEIKQLGDFHILELTISAKPFAAEETRG